MLRPYATISIDVDPIEFHLAAYGFVNAMPDSLAYTHGLPRIAEILDRAAVRATFFVAGRDVGAYRRPFQALLEAGHEIASHSFSRPQAFSRLLPAQMRDELVASRNAIESAFGIDVAGFRAPHGDLDGRGLRELLTAGYRYDASARPTPFQATERMARAMFSRDVVRSLRPRMWPFTFARFPHVWSEAAPSDGHCGDARSLIEFPASVTPTMRLPIDHRARFAFDDRRFEARLDAAAARGDSLSYPLEAIDALGIYEDRLDPRLAPHPGMRHSLAHRLRMLERSVRAIAERFEVVTFAERIAAVESCGQANDLELRAA